MYSLFSFDFAGCGKSDGLYVTLGFFERDDTRCVSRYLKRTKSCSSIAIWGHSMGAATAQMYATMDPFVTCCVIDSPFSDVVQLCKYHSRRSSLYAVFEREAREFSIISRFHVSITSLESQECHPYHTTRKSLENQRSNAHSNVTKT